LFILLKNLSQPALCYSRQTLAKVDLREREGKREREREREAQRIHNCFVLGDTLDFRKLY
jgi:hypothetical protein